MAETCCFIGGWRNRPCKAPARWVIVSSPRDSDVTYTCEVHVGDLLTDAPDQRVYRLDRQTRPGPSETKEA